MNIILIPLLQAISLAIDIYIFLLFVYIILGWLHAFQVVNSYNKFVLILTSALDQVISPPLNIIRRNFPFLYSSGIDFSPIVLLVIGFFVQSVISQMIISLLR